MLQHVYIHLDSIAMATSCIVYSSFTPKTITFCQPLQIYINLDYECSLWLESPLRLFLCISTNQTVGKESKSVNPM